MNFLKEAGEKETNSLLSSPFSYKTYRVGFASKYCLSSCSKKRIAREEGRKEEESWIQGSLNITFLDTKLFHVSLKDSVKTFQPRELLGGRTGHGDGVWRAGRAESERGEIGEGRDT